LSSNEEKNSSSSSLQKENLLPLNELSDQELEKCLLEDFSRRLELEKYFVFNLGELKTLSQADTQAKNIRATNLKLASDLTQLTHHAFKHLEKQGYKMQGGEINKRRVSFLKDADNDTHTYDNE